METTNNNIFNYNFYTFSPTNGGVKQETQIGYGEKNMVTILQRYYSYLCGEHTRQNTIHNKYCAAKILIDQTGGVFNQETIHKFKIWMNTHYSHNSRNNRINAWNQFLRWTGHPELQMHHIGFIETNQYALSEDEIDRLIQHTQDKPFERLILLLLYDGALRPSEIIDIRLDRRDGNRLYLDETKTGNKRIILSPMIIEAWEQYLQIRPTPTPGNEQYLILKKGFKEEGQKYKDRGAIYDIIQGLGHQVGLNKDITPYTIRRTSATLRQCKYSKYYMGDVKLVQTLFRHRDIITTLRYDRTTDIDIERYFNETQSKPHKSDATSINKSYVSPQTELFEEENDTNNWSFSFTFFNIQEMIVTLFCQETRGMVGNRNPIKGFSSSIPQTSGAVDSNHVFTSLPSIIHQPQPPSPPYNIYREDQQQLNNDIVQDSLYRHCNVYTFFVKGGFLFG